MSTIAPVPLGYYTSQITGFASSSNSLDSVTCLDTLPCHILITQCPGESLIFFGKKDRPKELKGNDNKGPCNGDEGYKISNEKILMGGIQGATSVPVTIHSFVMIIFSNYLSICICM